MGQLGEAGSKWDDSFKKFYCRETVYELAVPVGYREGFCLVGYYERDGVFIS